MKRSRKPQRNKKNSDEKRKDAPHVIKMNQTLFPVIRDRNVTGPIGRQKMNV